MFLPDYAFVLHMPLPHSVDSGQLNRCIRISLEVHPATTFLLTMFILNRVAMLIILLLVLLLVMFGFGVDKVAVLIILFFVVFLAFDLFVVLPIILVFNLLFVVLYLFLGRSRL